jgi:hypothetical protein
MDKEICLRVNCPFVAKDDVEDGEGTTIPKGTCLPALVKRISKEKVCDITVDVRISKRG